MANSTPSSENVIEITPKQSFSFELKEFVHRRELLYFFTWRNFKVRYKQTVIGAGWAVFRPLILMVVFTLAFNRVGSIDSGAENIPYPIFAYAGLMYWSYFSQTVNQVGDSLLSYQNIITKVYFPRLMVPIATTVTGLIDFFFSLIVYLVLALYYGIQPSLLAVLMLGPLLLLTSLTILGIGVFMAALNVKYRDVKQALPFFIQALLFLTPVIYPVERVPDNLQWILFLNPITGVVDTAQATMLGLRDVQWDLLGISVASCLVILAIGLNYFKLREREIDDII